MAYLRREGGYPTVTRPRVYLVGPKSPKILGREVLAQIKGDDSLRTIPTIFLTTSAAYEDVQDFYELQANSYVCKPVSFELFEDLVKRASNNF